MLTKAEQLILLTCFKNGSITKNDQKIIISQKFYTIVNRLIDNDLMFSNGRSEKSYRLTSFGKLFALALAKLSNTPIELQNRDKELCWFYG